MLERYLPIPESLISYGHTVSFDSKRASGRTAKDIVFEEGQPSDALYIVTKGLLVAERKREFSPLHGWQQDRNSEKTIDISHIFAGQVMGVESTLFYEQYDTTAKAIFPSEAIKIKKSDAVMLKNEDSEVAKFFLTDMERQLKEKEQLIVRFTDHGGGIHRILEAVADFSENPDTLITDADYGMLAMRVGDAAIGNRAGISRETTNKLLSIYKDAAKERLGKSTPKEFRYYRAA